MAKDRLRIAAISGSLRAKSFNTAALRAAIELAPPELRIELLSLHEIPLYNQDVEDAGEPETVKIFKAKIALAKGVLFGCPEYNNGITGVLKNAIDWASRPSGKGVLQGKPIAIVGASPGTIGTARSQGQLRQICYSNQMPLLPQQEVLISRAHEKFDASGKLTDKPTRDFMAAMLASFGAWIERLSPDAA